MGIVISFEGIEKSGKGTQLRLLEDWLKERSIKHVVSREPGGTSYGEAARRLVQDPRFLHRINNAYKDVDGTDQVDPHDDLNEEAEAFGYLLSRSLFAQKVILPAIQQGNVFIADRCGDSTIAYQGYGHWEGDPEIVSFLKQANAFALRDVQITRTYYIDIPVEESERRVGTIEFGGEKDRIERRSREYFERVRQGYLELAEREPERFLVLDGTQTKEEIHKQITTDLQQLIHKQTKQQTL